MERPINWPAMQTLPPPDTHRRILTTNCTLLLCTPIKVVLSVDIGNGLAREKDSSNDCVGADENKARPSC